MTQSTIAASTIAVSAYNVTSLMGPMTSDELRNAFAAQSFVCEEEELREALALALERGVLSNDGQKLRAVGPVGWIVWQRNDHIDPTGWSAWTMLNIKSRATAPFETLLQQGTTDA